LDNILNPGKYHCHSVKTDYNQPKDIAQKIQSTANYWIHIGRFRQNNLTEMKFIIILKLNFLIVIYESTPKRRLKPKIGGELINHYPIG
jgi:hypothetical protein